MPALAIDFETHTERGYNIKRLGTLNYVYHPKFHVIGCATCTEDGDTAWYDGDGVLNVLGRYDVLISHNALFDVLVLRRLLGDQWRATHTFFDTLAAARALLPRGVDLSLDALGRLLVGQGKLGNLEEGVDDLVAYAKRDAWLAMQLYQRLRPLVPDQEARLIDITTKMSTTPQVVIDHDVLNQELDRIQRRRDELCAQVGLTEEQLRKRDLVRRQLEIITGERPASLDKKHPDISRIKRDYPQARPLLEAREACSSNLERGRCLKLLELPRRLPLQYKYWGAHTGRWASSGGFNWQNLSHRSMIRQAITAPPGYRLVIADLSQIELRMNLWFCGEHGLLDRLASGEDLYCLMATQLFGRQITKEDKQERQLGKIVELASGYGQGWRKFQAVCAAGALGSDPIYLSDAEAQHAIQTYRVTHPHVVGMWNRLQALVPALAHVDTHVELGPVIFEHERIRLPNGTHLDYTNARPTDDGWVYGLGDKEWRLYSGVLLENIIQALARIPIAEAMIKCYDAGWLPAMTTHDEIVLVVPEQEAKQAYDQLIGWMTETPSWAPGLPLAAEGTVAERYTKP